MESVKNKMESLIKEKDQACTMATGMETEVENLKTKATDCERDIYQCEKDISKAEEGLDTALTKTKKFLEELDVQDGIASDAEQQVQALVRRIQLLEEESKRVTDRLGETLDKLTQTETEFEENERARKVLDARALSDEEKLELQDAQLFEARSLAEEADRKFDEMDRKLRMVENDYERIVDRAEQFETQCHNFEIQIKTNNDRLKELEDITMKNSTKEDSLETTIHALSENLSNTEDRAEFSERTVEKLEKTIDGLDDSLYQEKKHFQEISLKIDAMLGDMKAIHNLEAGITAAAPTIVATESKPAEDCE